MRLFLAILIFLPACSLSPPANPGEWVDVPEEGYRWRTLASPGRGSPGFSRIESQASSIVFSNTVSDSAAFRNRHLMQGSGVALGDVNGDGRPDIYLCRIEGPNALYLNDGGWRFHDVAEAAGVALPDRPSTGAVFADLNGDGHLDLIVTAMGGRNSLLLNDGAGHFTDATVESGFVPETRGSTTIALADVDGDGSLDLYITNYKVRTMLDSLPPEARTFERLTRRVGRGFEVLPEHRADFHLVERPELDGVTLVQRAESDWFYRNDGRGHFTRERLGLNSRFLDEAGRPLGEEPEHFGLVARFYDVNGDGAPDLYVANDFEDPDQFWINDGRGGFRLIPKQAVRRIANSNMAVDFADIDRDGQVDLFQVDMLAHDRRRKTQAPTNTTFPKVVGEYTERAQWQRNALLWNRGDGTFAEIADYAGVAASGWSWGTLFLDVDLDGYEDLLIANGHTWDLMDVDSQDRLRSGLSRIDWREERKHYPPLKLSNVAFRNRGDLTFEDVSTRWRWGLEEDISHGLAAADLDGDGDLDLVINRLDAPVALMRNDIRAPRLAVQLRGTAPNTAAIGARIRVLGGGGGVPEQSREVTAGGLYLSGSDTELSFATGEARTVTVEVRWRDGTITRIADAIPGRLYQITQPSGGAAAAGPPSRSAPLEPMFEDRSGLLGARHAETFFNDYARQPLLERSLSQLGPGVSWIDVDGDGRDDLIIPDGAGGELAWYRNEGNRFVRVPLGYPAGTLDFTMALGLPGSGGGPSLLIGRSSYQAMSPAAALSLSGVARLDLTSDGRKVRSATAIALPDSGSVGVLALGDLDRDGRPDLFVGARVIPANYPVPAASRLYRNLGDRFELDGASQAILQSAGLVSAALFTDLDGDGHPELVLASDGGPIRVYQYDQGRLVERTEALGLSRYLANWNGIAAGDFDGDGRMDLVATNWGRNLTYTADPASPRYLYVGSFGAFRSVDLIPARFDSALQVIAPDASFARLIGALPSLRRRVPSFADYAGASIDRLLGAAASRARRIEINTLDHLLLLNRGDRFEARPLPKEAQFAPAFGAVISDFDGDGREDLLLAQNFSQTESGTPRFDAGRGLLLLGDGKGGLSPLPGQYSGILVYGDQRGAAAADYDGDGRVDLAISQNGADTRLYRNQGAAPGLRVRLRGIQENPEAIGAVARIRYQDGALGPAREVHSGSGYWSQDGSVLVLGLSGPPRSLWIRWPGGREQEVPIAPDQRELLVRRVNGTASTSSRER